MRRPSASDSEMRIISISVMGELRNHDTRRLGGAPWTGCFVLGPQVVFIPVSARAHRALQGVGMFWSGVAHLLTSLDQLGFLLGLAIWTSFHDQRLDARVMAAGFVAGFAGVWLGARVDATGRLDLAAATAALMAMVG